MTVQELLNVLNLAPSDAEVVLRSPEDRPVALKTAQRGGIWTGGTEKPDREVVVLDIVK